jgi:hypothetical protein
MGVLRSVIGRAGVAVAVCAAVVVLLPVGATAAKPQEFSFTAHGVSMEFPPFTLTELNAKRAQIEYHGTGFIIDSTDANVIGGDWDVWPVWKVDLDQMKGTVSGRVQNFLLMEPVSWQGDFHGSLTPGGAEGNIKMHADDGFTFTGKWRTQGPVDPRDASLLMIVSGVVKGAPPT